jgi:hypothetical protein
MRNAIGIGYGEAADGAAAATAPEAQEDTT